jgi:hypothetical protein
VQGVGASFIAWTGWRSGTIALVAAAFTLACTVPTEGWNPKPTPTVASLAPLATPTPEVISGPQVPFADVMVGVWCTPSFESMIGTTMQCLSLAQEGTFNLGVVVNANVDPKSVLSGTYTVSDTGVTLAPRGAPAEVLRFTGNAGRPRLIDSTGRFTFEPFGRQPAP